MCGIAGIYSKKSVVSKEDLINMAKTMNHRGPDSTGFYVSKNRMIGLTHNRLSIIDVSESANQPMTNEDNTVWLAFNGEVYNFRNLRDKLERKAHKFKCRSDSEVIVHLYEEEGIRLVDSLNGMFAFCIVDEKSNRLLLARDRVGIKPLYFYFKNGLFAFSSELKAILTLPQVSRDLNFEALDFYFTLGYIPEDMSIFQDIKKLKPGHYLEYDGRDIKTTNYWDLKSLRHNYDGFSQEELLGLLEEKLRDSVRKQMVSDVPIGSFLSGGIDSSLVSYMMAQESDRPINTFTIGFGSSQYDETPYAKIVAKAIGSIHHQYYIEVDMVSVLEKLINHFDEPFADSSLIPTYYVSKVARDHVTVILSGDGGDELFGGYNWYTWVLFLEQIKKQIGSLDKILSYAGKFLPEGFRLKHKLMSLSLDSADQFLCRVSFFSPEEKASLYRNELTSDLKMKTPETKLINFFKSLDGDLIKKMTLMDFYYYLPEDILTKVDRASMAVSLETRVPWLDHEIVEFAYSLPSEKRINGKSKKYLSKELAKKLLPADFPVNRKQGFCIPIDQWMRGQLGDMLEKELKNDFPGHFLNTDYIAEIFYKSRNSRKFKYGHKLFSILIFLMWHRRFIIGQ